MYLLLRHAIPHEEKEFLIDQIDSMLEMMEGDEVLMNSLEIIYGKAPTGDPLRLALLFIQGIKEINFFEYVSFVQKIGKDA